MERLRAFVDKRLQSFRSLGHDSAASSRTSNRFAASQTRPCVNPNQYMHSPQKIEEYHYDVITDEAICLDRARREAADSLTAFKCGEEGKAVQKRIEEGKELLEKTQTYLKSLKSQLPILEEQLRQSNVEIEAKKQEAIKRLSCAVVGQMRPSQDNCKPLKSWFKALEKDAPWRDFDLITGKPSGNFFIWSTVFAECLQNIVSKTLPESMKEEGFMSSLSGALGKRIEDVGMELYGRSGRYRKNYLGRVTSFFRELSEAISKAVKEDDVAYLRLFEWGCMLAKKAQMEKQKGQIQYLQKKLEPLHK